MKYPIYVYRDSKANSFSPPMVEYNEPCAVRTFERRVHETGTDIGFVPGDFDLYCIGEFDSDSGQIISQLPVHIVNGGSLV